MPCTCTYLYRIQHVIAEGKGDAVVDMDGSYLYKKYKQMVDAGSSVSPLGPPPQPLQGWVALPLTKTGVESSTFVLSLPCITPGNNTLAHGYIKGFFVDVHVRYAPKKTSRCRLMKRNGTGRLMKRNGPFTIRSSSVRGPCVFSVRFESVLI